MDQRDDELDATDRATPDEAARPEQPALGAADSFVPMPGLSEQDRESLRVHIEVFEGPLDLLLHLIRKNEYDIFDIPIADITAQFLDTLELMKELNLSVAGEFLVMAATLMKIKSRMLLPPSEFDQEEEELDPRAALVKQLLEYQRYRDAADQLMELPRLDVDVFKRKWPEDELSAALEHADDEVLELNLYDLVEAFGEILKALPAQSHTIAGESFRVADKMNELIEKLRGCESMLLSELISAEPTRGELVAAFLALLELVKRELIKVFQAGHFGPIRIFNRMIQSDPEQPQDAGQEGNDG